MISEEDFIVVHALYEKGHKISEIARLTKLDSKTVRKRLKEVSLTKQTRTVTRPSKLDPYKDYIQDFISKESHRIPSSVILADIKTMGYQGGRSILQEFLTTEYKCRGLEKDPIIRFETLPGEQMQVDWTTIRYGRNPIYGFVATLGYSRHTFVCFTDNMEAKTLIRCHEQAFLFFGGVTKTILYDNMKAVVEKRNCYGRGLHKYQNELLDLAKRYGFTIKLCKPYRAKTKGKVERFNSYLKSNFYRPLTIKLKAANLEISHYILNQHIYSWLINVIQLIHGTTNKQPLELFKEELASLIPCQGIRKMLPENAIVEKPKWLPETIVKNPNLARYDLLLSGVAA